MQLKLKIEHLEQTNLTKNLSDGKNGKVFPQDMLPLLTVVLVKAQSEPWPAGKVSPACSCWEEAALPATLGQEVPC